MSFADSLNFTSANEDGQTELDALALSPVDRVLCLTASGARPLDLLLGDPGEIIALDSNPAQNHLLALKIAALRCLDDGALYRFLGIDDGPDRAALTERVLSALEGEDRQYWGRKRHLLERGIWHQGRWERVLRLGAQSNRLLRGRRIDALMAADDIAAQSACWTQHFDDSIWRLSIRILGQRWFWTRIIGEPGGAFLPPAREVADRLTARFRDAARRFLFRESDFATLIFRGRHTASSALPLHMRRENLDTVRARLDRIRMATGDLRTLNRDTRGDFTAFSLSDFGSYCDPEAYAACWQGVISVAEPAARFCERSFLNPLALPDHSTEEVHPDQELSHRLTTSDLAVIYEVRAGRIEPLSRRA